MPDLPDSKITLYVKYIILMIRNPLSLKVPLLISAAKIRNPDRIRKILTAHSVFAMLRLVLN